MTKIMSDFDLFLRENNYEDDLEFQLCDLENAFNAGKELRWQPSDEQITELCRVISGCSYDIEPLVEIQEHLKKPRK